MNGDTYIMYNDSIQPSPPWWAHYTTHGDAVVGDPAPAALADGGGVLQDGAAGGQDVDEDLPAVARQHVRDDLHPGLTRLLQHHRPT